MNGHLILPLRAAAAVVATAAAGGGRRAAGGQSGGLADQGEGGGSFAKPDTFCELACLALWRLCMRPMTQPSVASADPSPAGHINDNNSDL